MGTVVPFVLWFNFAAGFTYVAAGFGLWLRQSWAAPLLIAIATATVLVFLGFLVHAARGLSWEGRTMGAMFLRIVIWLWIAKVARAAALAAR